MTNSIILLALAVLPVFVLGTYVYRKDKFEKEPISMLFKAFFFGCLSVLPAIFIESWLSSVYSLFGGDFLPGAVEGLYTGFVVAGFTEELCKLLLLSIAVWKSRYFDEYFDGIVYATFVSLGFAGLENIMYVFGQDTFGASLATGSVRAILSVPAHFLFGVVMGYYFALAKFQPEKRTDNIAKALIYPMLLHGTFDSLLMVPEAMGVDGTIVAVVFFVVFLYFDVKLWKIGMRRLRSLQEMDGSNAGYSRGNQYSNPDDDGSSSNSNTMQDPFSGFNWNP